MRINVGCKICDTHTDTRRTASGIILDMMYQCIKHINIYRTQLYWIYIQNINTSHHFKDIKKDLVGDYITRDDEQDANSALQT